MNKLPLAAAAAIASVGVASASAQTTAYLRFEEGPAGTGLTAVTGGPTNSVTVDEAGGDDNFRTFNAPATADANYDTSPLYSTNVPFAVVPQTGAANNFSFDFGNGDNDDIYMVDTSSPLGSTFDDGNTFTIEASINTRATGAYDTFIGRDDFAGLADNGPGALFYLQNRADTNTFAFIATQKDGTEVRIDALQETVANQWYNIAIVGDGTNATLYVDGVAQGSAAFSGLYDVPAANLVDSGWTIGRGFYDNNVTDWMDGFVDEVRFSNVALDPSQLLAAPVPEPASLTLAAGLGLLALRRRR